LVDYALAALIHPTFDPLPPHPHKILETLHEPRYNTALFF
jgi:hypothetical protein